MSRYLLAPLATLVFAVAGCGSDPAPRASLDGCIRAGSDVHVVRFFEPRAPRAVADVRGAVIGEGDAGVVFANQSGGNLCDWLPFARRLAASGMRALVFDYGWGDPEDGALAAAAELRRRGVRRIAFVGASWGTRAAIVAGARQRDTAAVVTLSADMYQPPVQRAARRMRAPILLLTARGDEYGAVDTSHNVYALLRTRDKRLLVVPGTAHGIDLLRTRQLSDTVFDWLHTRLKP